MSSPGGPPLPWPAPPPWRLRDSGEADDWWTDAGFYRRTPAPVGTDCQLDSLAETEDAT